MGDPVGGVGGDGEVAPRELVLALRTGLDDGQLAVDGEIDGLVVADLEMEIGVVLDAAPVAAEEALAADEIDRSGDWHLLKLQEEMGELTQAYLTASGRTRRPADEKAREELALEMADTLGMLLLLARDEGIDLDAAVQTKWLSWLERESA